MTRPVIPAVASGGLRRGALARLVSVVFCLLPGIVPAAARPPNIIVLLADDAGWGDFSVSGNNQLRTPAIDSLARDGVSLDRFFVAPVCAPTRAEFLTGRYYLRTGVTGVSTGQERLNLDERTMADAFRAAGYATGIFGKWHNGSQWPYHPMARGFAEFFGYTSGHWGEYFDPPLEDGGRMVPTQGYIVDVCTDRALAFIERNRAGPFLCFVPFTTPHSPWAVPQADWQRFRDMPVTQRASMPDREVADETRCALAMMENQDRSVGRILERLDSLGLTQDTLVVYFSDNGPNSWRWNGGMKGRKGSTDEGGVRSVCYLRWPGRLPAGRSVAAISGAIDLLPTLTTLAGVPRTGERPLDGRDLSDLLLGRTDDVPERMLFSTWAGRTSVRTQTHRLSSEGHLYDMVADPGQTAAIEHEYPDLAASLDMAREAWLREVMPSGNAPDTRPIPVGFREFPITMLPARDGEPAGTVRRSSERAPNSSYFVNWTSLDDRLTWHVEVKTAGRYAVAIDYTCPEQDAGATIELSFREAAVSGVVQPGWDPPLHADQDTIPRPEIESPMKPFRALDVGEIMLPAGAGSLTLRALRIPGRTVMDLRRLTLTLLP